MGMIRSGSEVLALSHPFERVIADALARGELPKESDFGGIRKLFGQANQLATSLLLPEFLRLVCAEIRSTEDAESDLRFEFLCTCFEGAIDDFVLIEAVDILDECWPMPDLVGQRCFVRALKLVSERSLKPLARAAGLDAAMRWAGTDRSRQLRLILCLLDISPNDDSIFLSRATKLMGIAYSHWKEPGLVRKLREMSEIEGAKREAAFELGMVKLSEGVDAASWKEARNAFKDSSYWFALSKQENAHDPHSEMYLLCLELLDAFAEGSKPNRLKDISESISVCAFEMNAWHHSCEDPPWLGAQHAEMALWHSLALDLHALEGALDQPSWWEPGVIIERYLIPAYTASRSILKRTKDGGLDSLIRPRIESSLFHSAGQLHALHTWVSMNADAEWIGEAKRLTKKVEAAIREGERGHPFEASAVLPTAGALIQKAAIPLEARASAMAAIEEAQRVYLDCISGSEVDVLTSCLIEMERIEDFNRNPKGRRLFCAALVWTIRFLMGRLELTKGTDAGLAYLFRQDENDLPLEVELQMDYYRTMSSVLVGTEMEVQNIGGGRADLRFSLQGERIVCEVKRELQDASFSALEAAYSSQATDYQNVGVRLGILLVLDLSRIRYDGTPHIAELVKPSILTRKGETSPRGLVTVVVPGRRFTPSGLSVVPKTRKNQPL